MARNFFIADTHFGGENIRRYENRPFETAEKMDEKLIENWNRVVEVEDTVYVLGDFSPEQLSALENDIFPKIAEALPLIFDKNYEEAMSRFNKTVKV